jgi:hypothetical protein
VSRKLICILIIAVTLSVSGLAYCDDNATKPAPTASAADSRKTDLFSQTDANSDGFITPDELGRPKLFKRLDTNNDGKISRDEAKGFEGGQNNRRGDLPTPTKADIKYGPYPRNLLDFWQAKSDKPTPLIVFIHGGGFRVGDKSQAPGSACKIALDSGVSFASISYRFLPKTPIQDILRDCARAVQYLRCNAAKYNIDPKKVACFGGSAGAGSSLWLATHDDLADPKSDDPVLRESSRISAAACVMGQATYDLMEWQKIIYPFKPDWLASPNEIEEFYGFNDKAEMESDRGKKIMADCSMYSNLSKDDAPIWMCCSLPDGEPRDRNHLLHHPKHVQVIKKKGDEVGVPVETHYSDLSGSAWDAAVQFLLKQFHNPPKS